MAGLRHERIGRAAHPLWGGQGRLDRDQGDGSAGAGRDDQGRKRARAHADVIDGLIGSVSATRIASIEVSGDERQLAAGGFSPPRLRPSRVPERYVRRLTHRLRRGGERGLPGEVVPAAGWPARHHACWRGAPRRTASLVMGHMRKVALHYASWDPAPCDDRPTLRPPVGSSPEWTSLRPPTLT